MPHSPIIEIALMAAAGLIAAVGAACLWGLFKGASELRRHLLTSSPDYTKVLLKSPLVPGVSALLAARDYEESGAAARLLINLHFGKHELVLVLNGPNEAQRDRWVRELNLQPVERDQTGTLPAKPVRGYYVSRDPLKLTVVETEAGTYAAAYNAAVNAAQFPVLAMVDPEAEFNPEFALLMMRPFLESWRTLVGICGTAPLPPGVGLANRIGYLENLRRWIVRGATFARWHKLVPLPGSCLLLKREAVIKAGGFRRGLRELFLDLQQHGREIAFLPEPVSWVKPAATLRELHAQARYEQSQIVPGFNGLYIVRFIRPTVETMAIVLSVMGAVTGLVAPAAATLVLLASFGIGAAVSMGAVVMRELADPGWTEARVVVRLFMTAIIENLGYRQLRNLWMVAGALQPRRR